MLRLFFIALGGAIGTLFRYVLSSLDYKFSNGVFPFSTLLVNLTGSLIIGLLWGYLERLAVSSTIRMFVFVGLLGGFTTFSTFALENFNLMRDGEFRIAMINIVLSNILGVAFVFIGFWLSRFLLNNLKGGI